MSAKEKKSKESEKVKDRRGGPRPGSGVPTGYKQQKTLDKELARAALRAMVTAALGPMVEAQIANASGLKYLVARDKTSGKFRRLTEGDVALAGDSEREVIEVWEKDPNVSAFTDLLNRTLDKPAETVNAMVTLVGLDERIRAGRKRVDGAS